MQTSNYFEKRNDERRGQCKLNKTHANVRGSLPPEKQNFNEIRGKSPIPGTSAQNRHISESKSLSPIVIHKDRQTNQDYTI